VDSAVSCPVLKTGARKRVEGSIPSVSV